MAADLGAFLDHADAVVVPIIPSLIDLEATVPFLNSLAQQARVKKGKLPVALVGNRLKPWTSASQQAVEQLEIGRAHVCTPVTNAHLVCRLLLETKKHHSTNKQYQSQSSHN